ncbi:hypothetical protein, partial [Thermogutta sp.]|uniref:hypothetical protein n=1 Tax=Thermogutta sp. TaxID=1962930 RepID=UPI0032209A93
LALAGTPPTIIGRVDTVTTLLVRTTPTAIQMTSNPAGQVNVLAVKDGVLHRWTGTLGTHAFKLTAGPAGFLLTSRPFIISPIIAGEFSSDRLQDAELAVWAGLELHAIRWRGELLVGIDNLKPKGRAGFTYRLANW